MNNVHNALDLLGRLLIAWFFVPAGIGKIGGYAGTAAAMASQGIPSWLLPLVIATEIGAGLALLAGWHTRIAAFLLGGFSVLAVWFFHFKLASGFHQTNVTMAELAVAGGLFAIAARGAAGWSLDGLFCRTCRAPDEAAPSAY